MDRSFGAVSINNPRDDSEQLDYIRIEYCICDSSLFVYIIIYFYDILTVLNNWETWKKQITQTHRTL